MPMTNLDKFLQLSRRDRRLLFQSVVLLPLIHVALSTLGYHWLRGLLEKMTPLKAEEVIPSEPEIVQRASDIARIVAIASEHGLYRVSCLRQSLLLWKFLRMEGIQSKLCFGVRRSAGQLEAHAWVEYKGTILNDSAGVRENFQVLDEILPSTSLGL